MSMNKKNSSSLLEFQNDFVDAIVNNNEQSRLLENIIPSGTLTDAASVLSVHRNGYYARLTEVLGETFEGSWFVLGDELFFMLCELYIKGHRSDTYNLSNYGEHFPAFLQTHQDRTQLSFVSELATFEWTFKEMFHRSQHTPIDPQVLQTLVSQPENKLRFGSAAMLFSSTKAIYNIWELKKSQEVEQISDLEINGPEFLLLYKLENEIFVKKLSQFQYNTLRLIESGLTFSNVLDQIAKINQQEIIELFSIIGQTGIIVQLYK